MADVSQRQRVLFETLATLHGVQRKTYLECAAVMKISDRTLKRWSKTPEYQSVIRELQEEWTEQTTVSVSALRMKAIQTLEELAGPNTRSEHVRYEAGAKLGDWAGLGKEEKEDNKDDRGELQRLYHMIEQSRTQVINIQTMQVAPIESLDIVENDGIRELPSLTDPEEAYRDQD